MGCFWLAIALLGVLAGALIYWLVVVTEGAYLGARIVTLLYDWTAHKYDRLKDYQPEEEDAFLGYPLSRALSENPEALILDVAVGTGRLPLTLLRQPEFRGRIVALDRSARMLAIARRSLAGDADRCRFVVADAGAIPCPEEIFPAVTCLEALEFLPSPRQGLRELIRVLGGGGWLVISNRVGWQAHLMPAKTWSRAAILVQLSKLPLAEITVRPWQIIYDIVWARKRAWPARSREGDTEPARTADQSVYY